MLQVFCQRGDEYAELLSTVSGGVQVGAHGRRFAGHLPAAQLLVCTLSVVVFSIKVVLTPVGCCTFSRILQVSAIDQAAGVSKDFITACGLFSWYAILATYPCVPSRPSL